MSKYGHKKILVFVNDQKVNTIWHDGFTFWLAKENTEDGVGCESLHQIIGIVNNMYEHPSFVNLAVER